MEKNNIGEKIKTYRKKAGMSQFDLELKIGASPGSISRIETGEVNPTKETLFKISDALELDDYKTGEILNLKIINPSALVESINSSMLKGDFSVMIQSAIDKFAEVLNYRNISVFLLAGNVLRLSYMNDNAQSTKAINIISNDFHEIVVDFTKPSSLYSQVINDKKLIIVSELTDTNDGIYPENKIKKLQKITNTKKYIILPLDFCSRTFGCVLFAKEDDSISTEELSLLKNLAVTLSIYIFHGELGQN